MSFWQTKTLDQMDDAEWEALCDGCAKCCLDKYQYPDGEIVYTRIACHQLGSDCRCMNYDERHSLVPDCVDLKSGGVEAFQWLPSSCAYRLLSEGKPLQSWHPLVSGSRESVEHAGHSVAGRCVSPEHVHPDGWEEHIITWVT